MTGKPPTENSRGLAPRQSGADPRRHRRGSGSDLRRQGGRASRARRRGQARQRAPAAVSAEHAIAASFGPGLMERRVVFAGWLFPALLLMPQLAVTIVFFFWPAGQALVQSVLRQDAFGLSTRFVGWANFTAIFADPYYLSSFEVSFVFSFAVAVLALAPGLLFAVMADRVVRGATFYKTVLLLPYAIAPAIAGVLWMFLFNPSIGVIAVGIAPHRHRLEFSAERAPGDAAGDPRRRMEADRLQFPVLSRRVAGNPGIPARGLGDRRGERRVGAFGRSSFRCWRRPASFCSSSTSSTRFFDTFGVIHNVTQGGPGQGDRDPRLQGLV